MENLEKISGEFSFDKEKEIARSFLKKVSMGDDLNWSGSSNGLAFSMAISN